MAHHTPVECSTAAAWERWLKRHHAAAASVWIRMAKKDSGIESVTHAEALEVALCYGWIDGQIKAEDGEHFLQRFTPRTARSIWSKINRDKALKLIEEGLMQPAGLAEVERARADGRWEAAYDAQSVAIVPPDLQAALDANGKAKAFFAKLDSHNRYAVLFRIQGAKKPETRALRIARFVEMLAKGEKLHP
ncbi:bacteriocin-protection protein [Variovorax sp. Root318D1]|nr:bacteriocin-protection protein [Variovorax sp. Root318D1]